MPGINGWVELGYIHSFLIYSASKIGFLVSILNLGLVVKLYKSPMNGILLQIKCIIMLLFLILVHSVFSNNPVTSFNKKPSTYSKKRNTFFHFLNFFWPVCYSFSCLYIYFFLLSLSPTSSLSLQHCKSMYMLSQPSFIIGT